VRAGRIALEDVLAMRSAERFETLGLALSPRNPEDDRPSIGFLFLSPPGHGRCLLCRIGGQELLAVPGRSNAFVMHASCIPYAPKKKGCLAHIAA
jgi:hypothetical protein